MTLFEPPVQRVADDQPGPPMPKRPSRWSVRNWPVQWKVLAIALVPMVLAMVFGGLRAVGALTDASRLRLAADRAELVPAITDYMSALGNALVAASSGGDAQGAKKSYENRKYELQSRLDRTDVATDVRSGVTALAERGQGLLDLVLANGVGLRDEVTGYAPILLTAEDAINGSVRVDDERIRSQTEGLSRAVGARGQMMMQQLLINRGGELPDPELRASMMTLAGTEPSTLFGMNQVLGVDSPEAQMLHQQLVTRMAVMSDPAAVLPDNPVLRDSIRSTDEIATRVIRDSTASVTKSLEDRAAERRAAAIRDVVLTLTAIGTALVVVWLVARSLVRPLRTLRDSALRVAHTDLEREIAQVRAGAPGSEREPAPLPVYTTEEVGQVAHAIDELHAQALLLAGDEARLRLLVNEMFETMSRRNRSLVDQQLILIDQLERNEDDPDRLERLFRLDHLAARMRRNGANLLVLAGALPAPDGGRALPLAAVISAAISEVEGYHRVQTVLVPDATVAGTATGDIVHLLAELIDNALRYSPPTAPVRVVAGLTSDAGAVVEVVDAGLGMTETDLRMANTRLAAGGEVSPENARHMGLFVVSRLAHRHRIQVRLAPGSSGSRGVTAEVYLPPHLLVGGVAADRWAPSARPPEPVAGDRPDAAGTVRRDAADDSPVVSLLPRRTPGSSGITDLPAPPGPDAEPARRELPQPWWEPSGQPDVEQRETPAVTDTSGYFGSRARTEPDQPTDPESASTDMIYRRMLSELLVDPQELGRSADLDWKSVWDHGWSVAAEVDNAPIVSHTEHGLPVREPGARLVPGSATPQDAAAPVPSNGGPDRPAAHRAPDAVRASIGGHFGGVHAARTRPEPNQGPDHQ